MNIPVAIMLVAVSTIILIMNIFFVTKWYRKAKSGEALVRSGVGGTRVTFGGVIVIPFLQQVEKVDLSIKVVHITGGRELGLQTKEGFPINIDLDLLVKVNEHQQYVLHAAESIGANKTFDDGYIARLFETKLITSVRSTLQKKEVKELQPIPDGLAQELVSRMGMDLNGYVIEDIALRSLSIASTINEELTEQPKP